MPMYPKIIDEARMFRSNRLNRRALRSLRFFASVITAVKQMILARLRYDRKLKLIPRTTYVSVPKITGAVLNVDHTNSA